LTGTSRLGPNRGLEALAALGDGALLVGAERGVRAGALPLWRVGLTQTTAQAPTDSLEAPLGYGLTSLDALPDGRIFAVERFYAPGLGTRIRILTGTLPDPPGALALTELAVLAAPLTVDNLEGIAAVPQANGAVRLYLLADNNFSEDQRTLLFVFDWAGPGQTDPRGITSH
jgi:hypothetical protein